MAVESNYINRELSWLEFNQRVLDQARCSDNPLLERVKFLAITASNLNEFFMVRVGGLKILSESGSTKVEISGMTVDQQLVAIRKRLRKMYDDQSDCLLNQLQPEMEANQIHRVKPDELDEDQRQYLERFFSENVESVASPIAVDLESEFPLLTGAGICLCVQLRSNVSVIWKQSDSDPASPSRSRFVVLPLGRGLPRFVNLPSSDGFSYMLLEDVVGIFLKQLFADEEIVDWTSFRITRNADVTVDEDALVDLLSEMQEMLTRRKVSDCVRMEISHEASPATMEFLQTALSISADQIYQVRGPLDLSGYFALASIQGFQELKDTPWPAQQAPDLSLGADLFETIAEGDRILLHPYQSYDPVVDFISTAAVDPDVIAIKQTLYRTARDSDIISALIQAAENGKHVTAIVELKARFDEARNIRGAQLLEQAGADVIYGVHGLKTHAKICIVVRREDRGIQRYMHFGTGNYNESTSRLYSDVSYFTNHHQLGTDSVHFFNAVTGLSVPQRLELLSAAPINLRETFLELIQVEAENATKGGAGRISVKLNSLVDKGIIDALYSASKAGVQIRLNVRGICCLRPGVPGLSDNIEVISIVDRVLEHARIFHFCHGGDELVYIASADWMTRNLDRRVELMVPIMDPGCKNQVIRILNSYFLDNVKSKKLTSDGTYVQVPAEGETYRVQERLYQQACEMFAAVNNPKATVFKAHRGETA